VARKVRLGDMFGVGFNRDAAEELVIGGAEQISDTRHVLETV